MSQIAPRAIGASISLLAILLAACAETTAGQRVTDPTLRPMAQATQFYQQAAATQRAGEATVQANAQRLAATASVATQTQVAVDQRAVAQATAAAITQVAVATVAARDATVQAVRDRDATATAQAQAHADAVATRDAGLAATGTAVVRGTQTALALDAQAAQVQQAKLANWAALVLTVILALVGIWIGVSLADVTARRLSLAHYGPHRNPLVILPGGVVYNPVTGIASGQALSPELTEQLAVMGQQVLALQAQHSPHPPVKPEPSTRQAWHVGPVGATTERLAVERPPATALPRAESGKPVAPPARDKLHMVFIEGASMAPEEKKLFDLRELVEGAEVRGLTRARWEGYRFATGRECTQGYHKELMDILVAAQVVAAKGKTHVMRVNTDQAIEALGLQAYDYR